MGSWLSRSRVMLRDEGREKYEGERYKKDVKDADGAVTHRKGELVRDPDTLEAVDPPREARPRWPDKTGVYVRPLLTGADLQAINKLGRRSDVLVRELQSEGLESLHNDLEGLLPAVIQLSVVVKGFACRIATSEQCASDEEFEECNIFEDPRTRDDYVDEDNEGTPGTGAVLKMPDDIVDRVKTIALLPTPVLGTLVDLYSEQQGNPLPGTRAVA